MGENGENRGNRAAVMSLLASMNLQIRNVLNRGSVVAALLVLTAPGWEQNYPIRAPDRFGDRC